MGGGGGRRFDPQLWIRTGGCDGRDFLVGSCHTFPGRMRAYCPSGDAGYCVSRAEIVEMSPESARWVEGFLVGNEPRPEDMFGPDIHAAEDDDPRWRRWADACLEFRATGDWPHEGWYDLVPFPSGTELPPFVWARRADEAWTWDGGAWHRADPPTRHRNGLLVGSTCAEEGHSMTCVTSVHVVCDRCGLTSHTRPGELAAEE